MNPPSEANPPSAANAGLPHSILDLAPLELECMNALWPAGESTVRDIHVRMASSRPRAYTTIMTIMDRLAHKGIVTRRRVGRAYRYSARLSADQARGMAVDKIVTAFFSGSPQALAAHLAGQDGAGISGAPQRAPRRLREALAGEAVQVIQANDLVAPVESDATETEENAVPARLDETLL